MKEADLYPRYLRSRIEEALADSPVVLIHGPRQCGKTTLARLIGDEKGFAYLTFDDDVQRAAAQADPVGYVADLPQRVVLDEVQRVPELFTSLKVAVDTRRDPGRFILTGSANALLVPKLADSLAGRMEILRLHPLSQAELTGHAPVFLSMLFKTDFKAGTSGRRMGMALAERVAAGGYPAAPFGHGRRADRVPDERIRACGPFSDEPTVEHPRVPESDIPPRCGLPGWMRVPLGAIRPCGCARLPSLIPATRCRPPWS